MEVFTIFLCIVIGHAFGDLQGIEIDKEDLKAREDAREGLSPNVNEAINLDQYLQSKDAQLSAQSGSSNEIETDEKPSSPVIRSPVTSGAYEVKKSGQKKVYLETRVADIRSLWKHYVRSISAKKDSMKFRSFPVKSAAIKKRRSFRRKRDLDSFNLFMEPAFAVLHPPERRTGAAQNAPKTKKEKAASVGESKQEKAEEEKKEEKQEEKKEEEKKEEKKEEKQEEKKEEEKQEEKKEEKDKGGKKEEKQKTGIDLNNDNIIQAPKAKGAKDPAVTCDVKVTLSESQIQEFLDSHNEVRRNEPASDMRKLVWDPISAKLAQQKVDTCQFDHTLMTDCKGRLNCQSIWADSGQKKLPFWKFNVTVVTISLAEENQSWNYKTKTCMTGRVCGHWEILAGAKVQSIGCAAARCVKMLHPYDGHFDTYTNFAVCNYYPFIKGFTDGAPCSKCAKSMNATTDKGYTCEKKLCVPCDPKKDKDCKSLSGG